MLDDEIRHLTTSLHFTLSKADIFVWLMMNISSFSCSGSGFFRLSDFECFLFFQLIAQFYSSSLKLPNHHYLLSNTMRIWVSFFEIFNWGFVVMFFFKISFWLLCDVLAHFLEYCLVICRDCCCFYNETLTVLVRLAIPWQAIFKTFSFSLYFAIWSAMIWRSGTVVVGYKGLIMNSIWRAIRNFLTFVEHIFFLPNILLVQHSVLLLRFRCVLVRFDKVKSLLSKLIQVLIY